MERHFVGRALLDRSLRPDRICLFAGHSHPLDHQPGDLKPEVPDRRVGVLLARVIHPLTVDVRDVRRREVSRKPVVRGLDRVVVLYRSLAYARRLPGARLLLDVVPNLGGGEVLAAEGVRVNLRGGGDGRVAEAFADGRQVHAFLQQEARVAVADRVEACALGQPQIPAHPRHRARDRIRLQRRPVRL